MTVTHSLERPVQDAGNLVNDLTSSYRGPRSAMIAALLGEVAFLMSGPGIPLTPAETANLIEDLNWFAEECSEIIQAPRPPRQGAH